MQDIRVLSNLDRWIGVLQSAANVVGGTPESHRPYPAQGVRDAAGDTTLSAQQKRHAAGLMRVNHVGEICAQALYEAQALATRDDALREVFRKAAQEESDHLAWTRGRVEELGSHVSALVPLWYAGAFAIGTVASVIGDKASLGFMAETERQVEEHLLGHLDQLPAEDSVSRAIVEQMKADEVGHARTAEERA